MTVLFYLNKVEGGGETAFPVANNDTLDVNVSITINIMILSIQTDRSGQTVWIQIRLKKQSEQGLHCLPFRSIMMIWV